MTNEKMRADFEAEAASHDMDLLLGDDGYLDNITDYAWVFWQAANMKATQWRPIADAPEGTMILCANMKSTEARHWAYVAWVVDGKVCGHRMDMPTHWQPLPPPPTGTEQS